MISSSGKRRIAAKRGHGAVQCLGGEIAQREKLAPREAGGAKHLIRDGKQLLRLRMQIAEYSQQTPQDGPGGIGVQLLVQNGLEQRLKGRVGAFYPQPKRADTFDQRA